MHLLKMIAIGLLAWPAVEIATFIFVAAIIGLPAAFFLMIFASFAGLLVLRRVGGAITRFRATAGSDRIAAATLDATGMAPGLCGILLIIPGFISSLLGIVMLFPASRRWLLTGCRHMFVSRRQSSNTEVIDLAPHEWQPLPSQNCLDSTPDSTLEPPSGANGNRRRSGIAGADSCSDSF